MDRVLTYEGELHVTGPQSGGRAADCEETDSGWWLSNRPRATVPRIVTLGDLSRRPPFHPLALTSDSFPVSRQVDSATLKKLDTVSVIPFPTVEEPLEGCQRHRGAIWETFSPCRGPTRFGMFWALDPAHGAEPVRAGWGLLLAPPVNLLFIDHRFEVEWEPSHLSGGLAAFLPFGGSIRRTAVELYPLAGLGVGKDFHSSTSGLFWTYGLGLSTREFAGNRCFLQYRRSQIHGGATYTTINYGIEFSPGTNNVQPTISERGFLH